MTISIQHLMGSGLAAVALVGMNLMSDSEPDTIDPACQLVADCGCEDGSAVSELSQQLVMAQVQAPRPMLVPEPMPEPGPIAQAETEAGAEEAESSGTDAAEETSDGYCQDANLQAAYPVPQPAPLGPAVCVFPNRKRADGHYIGYVSYDGAKVEVDLELQSSSRDILLQLKGTLPEEVIDATPVLVAQLVASDGEREMPLGLQAELGAGIKNDNRLRFPLYQRVDGEIKAAAMTNMIESRLESPFSGLPRSFNAEQVTMYLWVQFDQQRYPVSKPLIFDLIAK